MKPYNTFTIDKWVQNGLCLSYTDDGKPVFIHGALPGETVEAEIVKENAKHAFAVTTTVKESAPDRMESDCPVFPQCGGCSFRHISYQKETELKLKLLEEMNHLKELLPDCDFYPSAPDAYRTRVRLHSDKKSTGFYKLHTNEVIPLPETGCLQLEPELNEQVLKLKNINDIRDISVARNYSEGIQINGELTIETAEDSFFQANRYLLRLWLDKFKTLTQQFGQVHHTTELFSGTGLIGIFAAKEMTEQLTGFESHGSSVKVARKNAKNLNGFRYHVADIYGRHWKLPQTDLILANPPRAGLGKAVQSVANSQSTGLIYSSCNPQTLNRDTGILKKSGWMPEQLSVFDFFPRTPHMEIIVTMKKT